MGPAELFLAKYGEKGYLVLRAILAASRTRLGGPRLGDFSYRDVKDYLARQGVSYNPSLLLSRLEKEYGLIETTYKSGGQHWWRVLDLEEIERAVRSYEGREEPGDEDDSEPPPPRVRLLRIQFYSLEPDRILETLYRLKRRRRLSEAERRLLRRLAFEDLPRLVEFLEEAQASYPDELQDEIAMAETILDLVESLIGRRRTVERLEDALLSRKRESL